MAASSPTGPSFYPLGKPPTLPAESPCLFRQATALAICSTLLCRLAFNANGSLDPIADTREQTLQCLANVCAVLAEAGVDRSRVFKASVWLTANADFGGFNAG